MVKDNIPEGGITLWDTKTLKTRPNSLDRLNIRLLLVAYVSILKDGARTKSRYRFLKALKLRHKFSKKVQRDCLKVFKKATKGKLGTFENEHTEIVQQYLKTYPKVKYLGLSFDDRLLYLNSLGGCTLMVNLFALVSIFTGLFLIFRGAYNG